MAEKGSALLLKRGDGGGTEVFTAVAGIRSRGLSINGETVDATNDDSSGWRELVAGAGITSLSLSGSGVVTNNADAKSMVGDCTSKLLTNYEIVVPGIGTFSGAFQLTTFDFAGEHNGEATYNLSMESSGTITFVAV
jgi:TP901-1 family phage major tail protein